MMKNKVFWIIPQQGHFFFIWEGVKMSPHMTPWRVPGHLMSLDFTKAIILIWIHISSSWWLNQPVWNKIVKIGNLPQIGVKIKHIWKHQLDLLAFRFQSIFLCWLEAPKDHLSMDLDSQQKLLDSPVLVKAHLEMKRWCCFRVVVSTHPVE